MCTVCDNREWLSRQEAGEYLEVHLETLRRMVRRGDVPAYRQGRKIMFRRSDLDEYLTPKPA